MASHPGRPTLLKPEPPLIDINPNCPVLKACLNKRGKTTQCHRKMLSYNTVLAHTKIAFCHSSSCPCLGVRKNIKEVPSQS
jgi:hypothetical protein